MAAIDRHHGKNGQIKLDKTGAATAVLVPSLDAWDLDMATDTVATTSFGDPNKTYVQGLPDIKGTFKGNFDDSPAGLVLFDVFKGSIAPTLELYPDFVDAATIKFSGHGWLSGKISVPADGKVAVSGSFVAADGWTLPGSGA